MLQFVGEPVISDSGIQMRVSEGARSSNSEVIVPFLSTSGMRRLAKALSLVAAVTLFSGCGDGDDDSPGTQAPTSEALATEGKFREAAELIAGEIDSAAADDRPALWARSARYNLRAARFKEALEAARRASVGGESSADLAYIEGESLRKIQRPTEAHVVLEKLLEEHPDHFEGALSLARLKFRLGGADRALELFEKYFQLAPVTHPTHRTARLEYGRALKRSRRFQDAADEFMTLLEEEPSERLYYSELSQVLYRMSLRPQAKFVEILYQALSENAFEEYVQDGLMASGRVGIALAQTALNRSHQKRYADAFQLFVDALAADDRDARIPLYYSELCSDFRRFPPAREALGSALKRNLSPSSGILQALGDLELAAANWKAAEAAFRGSLDALRAEGNAGGSAVGQAHGVSARLGLAEALAESGSFSGLGDVLEGVPANADPAIYAYVTGRAELAANRHGAASQRFASALRGAGSRFGKVSSWRVVALVSQAGPKVAGEELSRLPPHPAQVVACQAILSHRGADSALKGQASERLRQVSALAASLRRIERKLDDTSLAESSAVYEELGDLYRGWRDSSAFRFYLLATDLDPSRGEVIKKLVSGIREQSDLFVRLRLMRRLLAVEPKNVEALREIAENYVRLHVRPDEAVRLARELITVNADAQAFALLARALAAAGDNDAAKKTVEDGLGRFPGAKALADVKKTLE
jgi:predicted Zn-dependent protease